MATYQDMVNRIADEVGMRTDITAQIQNAIRTAIAHQDDERFFFNEQTATFATVANQNLYPVATFLPTLPSAIEWLKVTMPGYTSYLLARWSYEHIDAIDTNPNSVSQPYAWAYYNETIRFYPIPNQTYTITAFYTQKFPVLVNPTDSNPWTNQAEEMIRAFAKADLYSSTLMAEANAMQLADRNVSIGKSAKKSLRQETMQKASSGRLRVTRF